MSAPITEAHRKLATDLCRNATGSNRALHHVPKFAQLIADSEARAIVAAHSVEAVYAERDQLRAEVQRLGRATTNGQLNWMQESDRQNVRAERAEAELAAERARLDWLEDHGWITGEPCGRAAIDAAMKQPT